MRLSELIGREMINLTTGEKMGQLAGADLYIDEQTGKIDSVILPAKQSFFSFAKQGQEHTVSWTAIEKIGADMILIDLDRL